MKYLITIPILFIFALAIFSQKEPSVRMIPKPAIASVVFNDGRSVCEKKSQMAFSEKWDKLCIKNGKEASCELTESDAELALTIKQLSLEFCLR